MSKVFFSYSHDDEIYRDQLEKHLSMLRRQGLIESWHDRRIPAGAKIDEAISDQLEEADVILLLVSASFIASNYCYSREMMRALERNTAGTASVIPVIVRPCDWQPSPFGSLMAVPRDGKAITLWPNPDEAYSDIARQIRVVVEKIATAVAVKPSTFSPSMPEPAYSEALYPRSSNLRLKKKFSDRDRDAFLHEGFEFMIRFFKGSLHELGQRNPGIDGVFRSIDADTFIATIYREGKNASECAIRLGGFSSKDGITFSWDASARGNSYNEMLSMDVDDQVIYFRKLGITTNNTESKLSQQGAAEFYWSLLIDRLQ